jgi:hypothetical protein
LGGKEGNVLELIGADFLSPKGVVEADIFEVLRLAQE